MEVKAPLGVWGSQQGEYFCIFDTMKKPLLIILASIMGYMLYSFTIADGGYMVTVDSKDTKLPDWQWNSGEVDLRTVAEKQAFTIDFQSTRFHPGDSALITFNTYKITLTNLNEGTTFSQWAGWVDLVMIQGKNWGYVVPDTNDRLNKAFSNVDSHTVDSIVNHSVRVKVPDSRSIIMSVYAKEIYLYMAEGHPIWGHGKGAGTMTVYIKGIEVKKL
jgi:hypothetical protein